MAKRDYYEVLGAHEDASDGDLPLSSQSMERSIALVSFMDGALSPRYGTRSYGTKEQQAVSKDLGKVLWLMKKYGSLSGIPFIVDYNRRDDVWYIQPHYTINGHRIKKIKGRGYAERDQSIIGLLLKSLMINKDRIERHLTVGNIHYIDIDGVDIHIPRDMDEAILAEK